MHCYRHLIRRCWKYWIVFLRRWMLVPLWAVLIIFYHSVWLWKWVKTYLFGSQPFSSFTHWVDLFPMLMIVSFILAWDLLAQRVTCVRWVLSVPLNYEYIKIAAHVRNRNGEALAVCLCVRFITIMTPLFSPMTDSVPSHAAINMCTTTDLPLLNRKQSQWNIWSPPGMRRSRRIWGNVFELPTAILPCTY